MDTKDKAHFHIVLVQAWVRKDDRFLMAQRSFRELQAPGEWSIPGGKVESEVGLHTLEQVLKREIREEVGIEVEDKMEFLCNDAFVRIDGSHVVTMAFLCDYMSGEARAMEDTEKVEWFTLEELKNFTDAKDFLKRMVSVLVGYVKEISNNQKIFSVRDRIAYPQKYI